jgi:hypothetical protein
MILEAAHRLLASDKTQELRDFAASLSEDQRLYLLMGLPRALCWGWFGQNFARHLKTPKIVLEGSLELQAADYGAKEYQWFLIGMLHMRNIFPAHTQHGKIYRLTATKDAPQDEITMYKNEDQYRSLTSWTTRPKPVVVDRERPKNTTDIILCYDLPSAKNVLFDYHSAAEFIATLNTDREFYLENLPKSDRVAFKNTLKQSKYELGRYAKELEVALYLNAGQEIECTWRYV